MRFIISYLDSTKYFQAFLVVIFFLNLVFFVRINCEKDDLGYQKTKSNWKHDISDCRHERQNQKNDVKSYNEKSQDGAHVEMDL